VSQRKARNGRNPQTGATIKIAARKVAKFSPRCRTEEIRKQEVSPERKILRLPETAGGRPCRFLL